tara:strand:+ start:898 stop:1125 length:228 start_codon:yes stop_codon:yes gene_type:complete
MLLYFLLDSSTSIVLYLIKYLGMGIYYSISYLFFSNSLTDKEKEDRDTLEMLVKQQADIEIIKSYIENMEKEKKD